MRQLKQLSAVLIFSSAVCVASANAPISKKLANGAIIPSTSVASVQREVREEGKTITVSYSIPEAKVIPVGTTGLMNLKSGVYVVALVIDGAVVDTKKVVIK